MTRPTKSGRPTVAHLISSPFYGGPERQLVGVASAMTSSHRSFVGTFPDGGKSGALRDAAHDAGLETFALSVDTPRYPQMTAQLMRLLRERNVDVLCAHGYKADLVGRVATWALGIPCVAVSHGFTAATGKVRVYEALDKAVLRVMDAIASVSEAQTDRLRRIGIAGGRIRTIRNAIDPSRFGAPAPDARRRLEAMFARPPARLVAAIGRLSPEKGFATLVDAVAAPAAAAAGIGVLVFGDGLERAAVERRIEELGVRDRFVLAGFATNLETLVPAVDLVVLPSFTEGLPVVVLEAFAARVPVVATAVGGTPEVVEDGRSGRLVPPGRPDRLAEAMAEVLADEERRRAMGAAGRARVEALFSVRAQGRAYAALFDALLPHASKPALVESC